MRHWRIMDEQPKPDDQNKPDAENTIRFVYHKARHHRTFHPDGAWAAVTPQLEVQFSLFKDLRPLPDEVTHTVTSEGGLGDEILPERKVSPSLVREVDATVVVNMEAAKNLIELLARMVKQIETHIAIAQAKQTASETTTETVS